MNYSELFFIIIRWRGHGNTTHIKMTGSFTTIRLNVGWEISANSKCIWVKRSSIYDAHTMCTYWWTFCGYVEHSIAAEETHLFADTIVGYSSLTWVLWWSDRDIACFICWYGCTSVNSIRICWLYSLRLGLQRRIWAHRQHSAMQDRWKTHFSMNWLKHSSANVSGIDTHNVS